MKKEISDALNTIVKEKVNISRERHKLLPIYRSKISNLISQTPTGDLRNELTEINILVEQLLSIDEDLIHLI